MLMNFKFYEGVPVGPDNLGDFFTSVQRSTDAVLSLAFGSAGTLNSNGGGLSNRPVEYRVLQSSNGTSYYTLSAQRAVLDKNGLFDPEESKGIAFFKYNSRYFTEEINYIRTAGSDQGYPQEMRHKAFEDVTVHSWETVASGFDPESYVTRKELTYVTNIPLNPYRLIKEVSLNDPEGVYTYLVDKGVMDLRYNGIPQSQTNSNDTRFYTSNPSSRTRYESRAGYIFSDGTAANKITLKGVTLGGEHPYPVVKGKFKFGTTEGMDLKGWRDAFGPSTTSPYIDVRFAHSNFGTMEAHIIIRRSFDPYIDGDGVIGTVRDPKYVYIKEDTTSGTSVAEGHFKVLDKAKGVVRVNVDSATLSFLKESPTESPAKIRFTIVNPEQLIESSSDNGVVRFRSRYGKVFTGEYLDTELVTLFYDYKTSRIEVNRITEGINTDSDTDVLYSDKSSSVKNVVLALRYPGKPIIDVEAQKNKYYPDVLSMFYVPLIPFSPTEVNSSGTVTDISSIEAFVELNRADWYNQDVPNREYKPVSRKDEIKVSLKKVGEYVGGFDPIVFNPLQPIFRENSGASQNYYLHSRKVARPENVGEIEEYVRRDAALPEPHYINPPITKTFLESGDTLNITPGFQMTAFINYVLEENSELIVNGQFIII